MGRFSFGFLIIFAFLMFSDEFIENGIASSVTYDSKALVIDGQRRILFSGSIHYPRTTPEMWPEIIRKSKEGGLDVIETYVFWNYHEPEKGQYYFEGRFDLVKFVKVVQEAGLYVHLRIGPYACAEWNYGGFPMWLHFIPGIQFRTTNRQFQEAMESFLTKIVNLMKDENLFASQGGPIILAQIENEYGNVEWAYGIGGALYVKWAASTAVALNTSVPWVMCSQEDAPDPIINTCNGFYCDTFTPNSPTKPKIWTEGYTGWFLSFGYAIPYRPVEDLAFSVARFFETGGTFQNYYMYFGGTNFGRTAGGPLIATSYDYDAPLDEYGFLRQPKWNHLRDLHSSIKLCEKYLVNADPTYISFGTNLEGHIYNDSAGCAAFLANIDHTSDANVSFNGDTYFLPAWSVSILPDCKKVIFNTAKVVSQKTIGDSSHEHKVSSQLSLASTSWEWYLEEVGTSNNYSFTAPGLLEQINTTKDASDYLWYSTSINVKEEKEVYVHIKSLGHAALLFVNKELSGLGYGNHDDASFTIDQLITLDQGNNSLEILSMMIGLQNYGPWFDIVPAGIYSVIVDGFMQSVHDISSGVWTYQVGTDGEHLELDKLKQENSPLWASGSKLPTNQTLIWYKTSFTAPKGAGPLALNLASMGKGQAWVNGQSIGRYWPAYLSPATGCTESCDYRGTYDSNKCLKGCGQPAQTLYHIPRSWVNPGQNLLVLHEEIGGDPSKITVVTKTGQEICAQVSELDPPPVGSWKPSADTMSKHVTPSIRLSCEQGWRINSVSFASFGNPKGQCGKFSHGTCNAEGVIPIVQKECLGHESCSVAVSSLKFGDPCPGLTKSLAVEAVCSE
ncbi:beta-galactosidase 6-like [Dioscorea cayenensis subsp. rotundata]|uniref:Beta-galactosidase n=1 Tax=Dioscorea cayennensis subsp. rotundata TaxID=55577 RepID=A0AB40BLS5_DIOCR|nr:beta-galactosidase 6-like [Dioscorea cayenensis subsp. rotundata]